MSKRQLIERIQELNVTAELQFLQQFDEEALEQYLERLEDARDKRLRFAGHTPLPARARMVS